MHTHTHEHTNCMPASPRSIKSLEKRQLISCHSPQRDGQKDRWMERKGAWGRKWMIIIIIVEWLKNKRFPVLACVCMCRSARMCVTRVGEKLSSSSFSTVSFRQTQKNIILKIN